MGEEERGTADTLAGREGSFVKERPILFSGAMVCAILAGRKTQTRRIVRSRPAPCFHCEGEQADGFVCDHCGRAHEWPPSSPYGAPGDRLWVRETWFPDPPINGWPGDIAWNGCGRPIDGVPVQYRAPRHCLYAATWQGCDLTWRPSIHMPRWASRIALEVTEVRVERLQAITEGDAKAEGFTSDPMAAKVNGKRAELHVFDPIRWYAYLWDSINGAKASWVSNPWVWRVSFKRVSE